MIRACPRCSIIEEGRLVLTRVNLITVLTFDNGLSQSVLLYYTFEIAGCRRSLRSENLLCS